MYLVTLKSEYEVETGSTKLAFASPMAILRDDVELESEEDAFKFNDERCLMVPNSYTITEDSRFLIDLSSEEVIVFEPTVEEDEEGTCNCTGNCKCKTTGNNFYYAVVSDSEKEPEQGDLDKFTVNTVLMRTDAIAPQFVIGYAKEGQYVIPIERIQFESLVIGEDMPVYMDEYYDNITFPEDGADDVAKTDETSEE